MKSDYKVHYIKPFSKLNGAGIRITALTCLSYIVPNQGNIGEILPVSRRFLVKLLDNISYEECVCAEATFVVSQSIPIKKPTYVL